MKAYTLLDIQSNNIFHSRDVIFYESIYPLTNNNPNANIDNFFPATTKPADNTSAATKPADNTFVAPTPVDITSATPGSIILNPPTTVDPVPSDNAHSHPIHTTVPQTTSKSGRNITKPLYLQDYICDKAMDAETDALERNHTWIVTYHQNNIKGISVSQRPFTMQLLQDTGHLGSKPNSTTIEPNLKLSNESGDLLLDPKQYRSLIGKLIYLTITRPDISFAVNKLSQYIQEPRQPH
uniref:Reverse transcriptase Ty1/copia-type domain-containing protein n=1 Tax=Cannabis sativa TaxID=3483 RepID=A0A803PTH3_CANSA